MAPQAYHPALEASHSAERGDSESRRPGFRHDSAGQIRELKTRTIRRGGSDSMKSDRSTPGLLDRYRVSAIERWVSRARVGFGSQCEVAKAGMHVRQGPEADWPLWGAQLQQADV